MALLQTPAASREFKAPDFCLKNVDGATLSYADIAGPKGTVVAFICNHCPYVKAVITRLVADFNILRSHGVGVAAIMPNDTQAYPDDSFENMQKFAAGHHFHFPYLIDKTQKTARAYGAVCTPDIFGFDASGILQYRGRLDSAGPNPPSADLVHELVEAMESIAKGHPLNATQFPSMGCSIKWISR